MWNIFFLHRCKIVQQYLEHATLVTGSLHWNLSRISQLSWMKHGWRHGCGRSQYRAMRKEQLDIMCGACERRHRVRRSCSFIASHGATNRLTPCQTDTHTWTRGTGRTQNRICVRVSELFGSDSTSNCSCLSVYNYVDHKPPRSHVEVKPKRSKQKTGNWQGERAWTHW